MIQKTQWDVVLLNHNSRYYKMSNLMNYISHIV